ncbi:succinyldiaminopimelate transaminase [Varibaculum prostatecancerukia]|uniref:succinyldiaminopimelate transaminase n=1 Tax=Varibaculum prostatecancerukia TaxID=2811781 RepID=UPI001C007556|nr:succinyldiaminopimelate transaminase [Varibaculum prostatecancerukia]
MKNTDLPRPLNLPVFPWDLLDPYREKAAAVSGGAVDLSIGTPVDSCPQSAQSALAAAANSPGYPTVIGSPQLRRAIVSWARKRGITCLTEDSCLPTVGSKELVANLGWQLGIGAGDKILFPEIAYPTYDICARLAGAQGIPVSNDISTWPRDAALVWINTPANPTGWVASKHWLREVVSWAREVGAVVASDECYAELTYGGSDPAPSLLQEDVCGDSPENLLLVYSVSKESNLAGYRAAFIAGDPQLIPALVAVRKHSGQMMPAPVQSALTQVLSERSHVGEQVERYARRRKILAAALENAGLKIAKECQAGLYLWVFDPKDPADEQKVSFDSGADWRLLDRFAQVGLVVAPESFYNSSPGSHVRVALCVSDQEINKAANYLATFA